MKRKLDLSEYCDTSESKTGSAQKPTFIQRIKNTAMKVLSFFTPEIRGFSPELRRRFDGPSVASTFDNNSERFMYDAWVDWNREGMKTGTRCTASTHGQIREIPIQLVGHDYKWEGGTYDSDLDIWNMNNSSNLQRKPLRRSQRQQTVPSSQRMEDINLEESVSTRHPSAGNPHKILKLADTKVEEQAAAAKPVEDDLESDVKRKRSTVYDDSDDENEINETNSYEVYDYLKVLLASTGRQIDCIRGDGNCFFRALSKIIYGNQSFYNEVRQAVVDMIEKNPKKFEAFTDKPVDAHIKDMREDKTWATQTEIYAAATLLNKDIYMLSPVQFGETYKWLLFSPRFKYKSDLLNCPCYITLCHTHGNHYDRIAPLDGKKKCNCHLDPPTLSGTVASVDLTDENEIV